MIAPGWARAFESDRAPAGLCLLDAAGSGAGEAAVVSACTGARPLAHGIVGAPGEAQYLRALRRTKACWDRLAEAGYSVGVVGLPATHFSQAAEPESAGLDVVSPLVWAPMWSTLGLAEEAELGSTGLAALARDHWVMPEEIDAALIESFRPKETSWSPLQRGVMASAIAAALRVHYTTLALIAAGTHAFVFAYQPFLLLAQGVAQSGSHKENPFPSPRGAAQHITGVDSQRAQAFVGTLCETLCTASGPDASFVVINPMSTLAQHVVEHAARPSPPALAVLQCSAQSAPDLPANAMLLECPQLLGLVWDVPALREWCIDGTTSWSTTETALADAWRSLPANDIQAIDSVLGAYDGLAETPPQEGLPRHDGMHADSRKQIRHYIEQGCWAEAFALLKPMVETVIDCEELKYLTVAMGLKAQQRNAVDALVKGWLRAAPDNGLYLIIQGLVAGAAGQTQAMHTLFDQGAENLPLAPEMMALGYGLMANAMIVRQNYTAALRVIESGLELEPDNAEALTAKAHICLQTGRLAEAEEIVDALLNRGSASTNAKCVKAVCLARNGEIEAALEFLETALIESPNASALHALALDIKITSHAPLALHLRHHKALEILNSPQAAQPSGATLATAPAKALARAQPFADGKTIDTSAVEPEDGSLWTDFVESDLMAMTQAFRALQAPERPIGGLVCVPLPSMIAHIDALWAAGPAATPWQWQHAAEIGRSEACASVLSSRTLDGLREGVSYRIVAVLPSLRNAGEVQQWGEIVGHATAHLLVRHVAGCVRRLASAPNVELASFFLAPEQTLMSTDLKQIWGWLGDDQAHSTDKGFMG